MSRKKEDELTEWEAMILLKSIGVAVGIWMIGMIGIVLYWSVR